MSKFTIAISPLATTPQENIKSTVDYAQQLLILETSWDIFYLKYTTTNRISLARVCTEELWKSLRRNWLSWRRKWITSGVYRIELKCWNKS
ncbi:2870_t:CDS:2 [Rhizophagus irregularis]|nr:2870_t:CDS:2 [Rhizophagus irregularis]